MFLKFSFLLFCFSELIPFQVIFVAVKCVWFFLKLSGWGSFLSVLFFFFFF